MRGTLSPVPLGRGGDRRGDILTPTRTLSRRTVRPDRTALKYMENGQIEIVATRRQGEIKSFRKCPATRTDLIQSRTKYQCKSRVNCDECFVAENFEIRLPERTDRQFCGDGGGRRCGDRWRGGQLAAAEFRFGNHRGGFGPAVVANSAIANRTATGSRPGILPAAPCLPPPPAAADSNQTAASSLLKSAEN